MERKLRRGPYVPSSELGAYKGYQVCLVFGTRGKNLRTGFDVMVRWGEV